MANQRFSGMWKILLQDPLRDIARCHGYGTFDPTDSAMARVSSCYLQPGKRTKTCVIIFIVFPKTGSLRKIHATFNELPRLLCSHIGLGQLLRIGVSC